MLLEAASKKGGCTIGVVVVVAGCEGTRRVVAVCCGLSLSVLLRTGEQRIDHNVRRSGWWWAWWRCNVVGGQGLVVVAYDVGAVTGWSFYLSVVVLVVVVILKEGCYEKLGYLHRRARHCVLYDLVAQPIT